MNADEETSGFQNMAVLTSSSSAFIHPLLDVGLSSDLPSLPILSRTDPILPDNGCYVTDPSLLWPLLASP